MGSFRVHHAIDIGHIDQLECLERHGYITCCGVCVDIEAAPEPVNGNGRDNRDIVAFKQGVEERGIDPFYLADMAKIHFLFDSLHPDLLEIHLLGDDDVPVTSREPHTFCTTLCDERDDPLVDLSDKHHLGDLQRFLVDNP